MDIEQLFEEIRFQLNEALFDTLEEPWTYENLQLERGIRSAMRHLRSLGISFNQTMDANGSLSAPVDEEIGMLISYRVSATLLKGDLLIKLMRGQLGMLYKTGGDVIDTKTAARGLLDSANELNRQYEKLFLAVATRKIDEGGSVLGSPLPDGQAD